MVDVDILVVFGVRPEIIKMSRLFPLLDKNFKIYTIYTGQHFDNNMKNNLFSQMDIRWPNNQLDITSSNVETMVEKINECIKLNNLNFKCVLAVGSSNSAVAGVTIADNFHKPFVHIGAGVRSFDYGIEDRNNKFIDKLSTVCIAPTEIAKRNLENEGVKASVYVTGALIYEVVDYYKPQAILPDDGDFVLLTMHKQSNVDDKLKLSRIMREVGKIAFNVIYPIHPRAADNLKNFGINVPVNISIIDPVPYFEMLGFMKKCKAVVTDSSTMQCECALLGIPCFTLRDSTDHPETIIAGQNFLVGQNFNLLDGYLRILEEDGFKARFCGFNMYGKDVGQKIVDVLNNDRDLKLFDIKIKHRTYLCLILNKFE